MIPSLLHPVPVVIAGKSTETSDFDEDAREPIGNPDQEDDKTIDGQVKWRGQFDVEEEIAGVEENAAGYVLFRYVDLAAAGHVLETFDQIKKIGTVDTDVYVIRLAPIGHYPDQSGPTMVKAYFADRQPARQTRGTA